MSLKLVEERNDLDGLRWACQGIAAGLNRTVPGFRGVLDKTDEGEAYGSITFGRDGVGLLILTPDSIGDGWSLVVASTGAAVIRGETCGTVLFNALRDTRPILAALMATIR